MSGLCGKCPARRAPPSGRKKKAMDVQVERILAAAHERARKDHLPYFGALSPSDAYAVIKAVPNARLIDVRTRPEWDYVGHVPESSLLEWNAYPDGRRNPEFLPELRVKAPDPEAPVLFLCRSGHRSTAQLALPRRQATRRRSTSSKDSKATRMPTGSAASWVAGARPGYHGFRDRTGTPDSRLVSSHRHR